MVYLNSPKRTAAILSCLSGYLGKNLYSSNRLAIMHSKIDCSLSDVKKCPASFFISEYQLKDLETQETELQRALYFQSITQKCTKH